MTKRIKLLLARIESYCRRAGIAETTFGAYARNDSRLVARIRSGRAITIDTYDDVVSFISRVKPEKVRQRARYRFPHLSRSTAK